MMEKETKIEEQASELRELRLRLAETEEVLGKIYDGSVDAVVVPGDGGRDLYMARGAERPYRILVESMNEGAVSLTVDGEIIYANKSFVAMTGSPSSGELVGTYFKDLVANEDNDSFDRLWKNILEEDFITDLQLSVAGANIPVHMSFSACILDDQPTVFAVITDMSERKQVESALKESENRFMQVAESAGEWIWEVDADGLYTYSSPVIESILGYKPEELVGKKHFYDLFIPNERQALKVAAMETIAAKQPIRDFINRNQDRHGQARWLKTNGLPVLDDNGNLLGYRGADIDITEQKQAEAVIQREQDMLERTEANANIGSWRWDVATGEMSWSDESYRQFERDPADGAPFFEELVKYFEPEDAARLQSAVGATANDGTPYELELRAILPSGEKRVFLARGHAEKGADGKVTHLFGSSQDISERIQTRTSLIESEAKYRELFEKSKDTIFISSPDFTFVDINPAGVELLGYTSTEELLQADSQDFLSKSKKAEFLRVLKEKGYIDNFEIELWHVDGHQLTIEVTATTELDSEGNISAILGVARDKTRQLQMEREMYQAQKMESIGRLAGGVAHDFNNILTAINGYTELAEREIPDDNPAIRDLGELRKAASRAAGMARQLLIFSRSEQSTREVSDLNEVISALVNMLQRIVGDNYVLKTDLCGGLLMARIDKGLIEQVIMNLVINAQDAMLDGGEITISSDNFVADEEYASLYHCATPGEYVCFAIKDTGTGMDNDTVLQIFDPFFSTKVESKGTGLGLSVAFSVVEQHEGWIEVRSSPGSGSTFTVYLPATSKKFSDESGVEDVSTSTLQGRSECVLLVEDDENLLQMSEKLLSSNGYQVLPANDAEEAFEIFKMEDGDIDLLFSDVMMPGMDGAGLAEKLLAMKPGLPVLLATGYSGDALKELSADNDKFRLINKPYSLTDLLATIKELLTG